MKVTLIAAAALALAASLPASAQTPAPAPAEGARSAPTRSGEAVPPRARREPSVGQVAARERQRKCAAEWRQAKAGGKVAEGMKWPGFWSRCNARLKGAAA
jgi:hypothetical protein